MAALAPKPRNRAHFAVRFASSALRIAAVLAIAAGAAGTFGLANLSQIPGTENLALPPIATIIAGVFIVALAVVFALILWGFADGLVLLADLDDAQRDVQRQLADLVLAQRTARGPFHKEAVEMKALEEKALR
ncbi:MAG: hypothetical protein E6I57_03375 [Chloroflexi bacterium]|nr:MAG: hypothetical protein E6J49_14250 [Chloroflexota bacterium]TMB92811.1 MAG: hypothetical protein E6J38_12105 [Chloroflexota bacterium]TMC27704.1 MAG: hypothetical protein E6J27_10545 [Chloroflexota bacterium]TMC35780.1 MAG: hypothetical protein E6J24_03465 [Chloroflexota bacterium]TME42568.1 MAG: hypothetical protein E6I57_03375 [Chloroflexota bacterium]